MNFSGKPPDNRFVSCYTLTMKTAVIVFPGSNCDRDMAEALRLVTGQAPCTIWHGDSTIPDDLDLIALPGGFSHGDYLRSGAMAARAPVMGEVHRHARRGTRILGVCNGFQILTEAGLLPGALLRNRGLLFICRTVHVAPVNANTAWTEGYAGIPAVPLPIAHHDGSYFIAPDDLKQLEDNRQVAFRYCAADGTVTEAANPNGSVANIAGVLNATGNVLGLMPHPERVIDPILAPQQAAWPLFAGALGLWGTSI
jgi:phosphoribosylformylglycinamidine synthase subunit PurQ / glutaminase